MEVDKLSSIVMEDPQIDAAVKQKWFSLLQELAALSSAVVAYSGGVDSSFLAFAASQVLGNRMIAVTVATFLDPPGTLKAAVDFAALQSFDHVMISHDPLQNADFRGNPVDRCYFCKRDILRKLWNFAAANNYANVIEGQNADDQTEYRPGRKAVEETGTRSPLAHNGLSKADIRSLAKVFGLPSWNQPSSPCLATRIPYGIEITQEIVAKIAGAESYLHEKGFKIARVRYHQNEARIEVEPQRMTDILNIRQELIVHFRQLGFIHVSVDLRGYRSGSMDEGLRP